MLVTVVVLDSVGVGALPDAASFGDPARGGDASAFTLNHTLRVHPVHLPNLAGLGIGRIENVETGENTIPDVAEVMGAWGRMNEQSGGKDSSTGHWEMMGAPLEQPFQVYPTGFPAEVMAKFDAATGRGHLCNLPYSGSEVIADYGAEHLKTGFPIVYTSADSVFQVAAHVDKVPLETLYEWCEQAREILQGPHAVARVIARPFDGEHPFNRLNEHRHDYSLLPPHTVLDAILESGQEVIGVGKVGDLFAQKGFSRTVHSDDNTHGIRLILEELDKAKAEGTSGLLFANLVDFDSKYGHRRDPVGYAKALKEFDDALPSILAKLPEDGILFIVSDHGNDPTFYGSDHTREYALLLAAGAMQSGPIGTRKSFADLGATVANVLDVKWDGAGTSFLPLLISATER